MLTVPGAEAARVTDELSGDAVTPDVPVPPAGALAAVAVAPDLGMTVFDGADVACSPAALTARTLNTTAWSWAGPLPVALVAAPGPVVAMVPSARRTS